MNGSDFSKDWRRQQELKMRPVADKIYKNILGNIKITRFDKDDDFILDRDYAIDIQLTLETGMLLLGQEKFLSYNYANFNSVTIEYKQNRFTGENGDWYKLCCQIYFVGYCNQDYTGFAPWVLLNWSAVVLATNNEELQWRDNFNKDGRARASFRYCNIKNIPQNCIIAKSEINEPKNNNQINLFNLSSQYP